MNIQNERNVYVTVAKSIKLEKRKLERKKLFFQLRFSSFNYVRVWKQVHGFLSLWVLKIQENMFTYQRWWDSSNVLTAQLCTLHKDCNNFLKIIKVSHIIDSFHCFIKLLCLIAGEFGLNFHYLLLNNLHWDWDSIELMS